uniref:Uncharacterized protein n=1 Tax=Rhizophora mucronata TaxID=61149 RepID=A0A2P2N9S3_RHIMU
MKKSIVHHIFYPNGSIETDLSRSKSQFFTGKPTIFMHTSQGFWPIF